MARRLALPVLVPLLLLLVAWAAAPIAARAGDPCFHSTDRPPVTDAAATDVAIGDCFFLPTIARVPVGATVTFTNGSAMGHEVAGANLTWGAAQKAIPPGGTVSQTFAAAGVYPYSCMIHPGMTGAIVVGDGGSAAAVGAAPVGEAPPAAVTAPPEAAPVAEASGTELAPLAIGLVVAAVGGSLAIAAFVLVGRRRRAAASS